MLDYMEEGIIRFVVLIYLYAMTFQHIKDVLTQFIETKSMQKRPMGEAVVVTQILRKVVLQKI